MQRVFCVAAAAAEIADEPVVFRGRYAKDSLHYQLAIGYRTAGAIPNSVLAAACSLARRTTQRKGTDAITTQFSVLPKTPHASR
jgi:hypothetical protein